MLRLSLLAACLLAAIQITVAANPLPAPGFVRYVKLSTGGVDKNSGKFIFKKGDYKYYINPANNNLPVCDSPPMPGRGGGLAVGVEDWAQYDDVYVADNFHSAVVSRKNADYDAIVTVETFC